MSQLLDTLIGMDPSGDGALLLCAITAALLGILLVVGFGLVRPPSGRRRAGPGDVRPALQNWGCRVCGGSTARSERATTR